MLIERMSLRITKNKLYHEIIYVADFYKYFEII